MNDLFAARGRHSPEATRGGSQGGKIREDREETSGTSGLLPWGEHGGGRWPE